MPICKICGIPLPSSPTNQALAASNSTSELALALLPNLSFKRCTSMALIEPSGKTLGIKKQDRPAGVCAKIKNASHIGAEKNHLWPVILYFAPQASEPSCTAIVVLALTSEPPCFSVMPIPIVTPVLFLYTAKRLS